MRDANAVVLSTLIIVSSLVAACSDPPKTTGDTGERDTATPSDVDRRDTAGTDTAMPGDAGRPDSAAPETGTDASTDEQPPSVALTNPSADELYHDSLPVEADASDNVQVAKLEFGVTDESVGETLEGKPWRTELDISSLSAGDYTLRAEAVDRAGLTANDERPFTIDRPPSVAIEEPADGATLSEATTIEVTAEDDVDLASVELLVDGEVIGGFGADQTFDWAPGEQYQGTRTLAVRATDGAGQTEKTSIEVTVECPEKSWYLDEDGDGYGTRSKSKTRQTCKSDIPSGYVADDTDCDDGSANTHPGAAPKDDQSACMKDADGDGYGDAFPAGSPPSGVRAGTDCDDGSAVTYVGAAGQHPGECMKDADNDGYGAASPPMHVAVGNDCNDMQSAVNPGAMEACGNDRDDNCSGVVNEGCPCNYNDNSQGVCGQVTRTSSGNCPKPSAYEATETSCDDKDNDCDGTVDGWSLGCTSTRVPTPSSDRSKGRAVTTGPNDTTYIAGDIVKHGNVGVKLFVAKYDATGTRSWYETISTPDRQPVEDIAVDGSGNVYVVGKTNGNLGGETNNGGWDAYFLKVDSSGTHKWTKLIGTSNDDYARGVALHSSGDVVIGGDVAKGTINVPGEFNDGGRDAFFARYETNGNRKWFERFGAASSANDPTGPNDAEIEAVATDAGGHIYLTGDAAGSLFTTNPPLSGPSEFLLKYDGNGDRIWTRRYRHVETKALAVGTGGSVYVGGYAGASFTANNQRADGPEDLALGRFDSRGNRRWFQLLGSSCTFNRCDRLRGLAPDGKGGVYLAGWTGGDVAGRTHTDNSDALVAHYEGDGERDIDLFTSTGSGGAHFDYAYDVAVGASGEVVSAGAVTGELDGRGSARRENAFLRLHNLSNVSCNSCPCNYQDKEAGVCGGQCQKPGSYETPEATCDSSDNDCDWELDDWEAGCTASRFIGSHEDDRITDVAVDGRGHSFVVGEVGAVTIGTQTYNGGTTDAFLAEFDADGRILWVKLVGTSYTDGARGLALGSSGDLFVAGHVGASLGGHAFSGSEDAFVARFDGNGNRKWIRLVGTNRSDRGRDVAVDGSRVYLVGDTETETDAEGFVARYDTSSGNRQWIDRYSNSRTPMHGVAVGGSGAVYVTGRSTVDLDGETVNGNSDGLVAKYDPSGTRDWVGLVGSATSGDSADWLHDIAVGSGGGVYAVGYTQGKIGNQRFSGGRYDGFLVKYDSVGTRQWVRMQGDGDRNRSFVVDTTSSGNVLIATQYTRTKSLLTFNASGTRQSKESLPNTFGDLYGDLPIQGLTVGPDGAKFLGGVNKGGGELRTRYGLEDGVLTVVP